jgi:GAF domain-containing protein
MSASPLDESLAALSRFFVGAGTMQETLDHVAHLTVAAVEPAQYAGLTMIVEGRQRTAVFTHPEVPEIDQAQYDTGEGPCLAAFETGEVHIIESTDEPGRWPEFRRTAARHGIRSTLSVPVVAEHGSLGALNLYSSTVKAFGPYEQEITGRFAEQSAVVLANAQAYWDAKAMSERLGEAMAARAIIEQAKGILMGAQRCTADDAFELLVRASQRENVKLRDIAARIVETASTPGPDPGTGSARPA